jgi:Fe-S-cluster-containing dehydrogenase component
VVEKCTLCNHITATSNGVENLDDTADPAHAVPPCVHNCSCGARHFGDLDDPSSGASKALAEARKANKGIYALPDPSEAEPTTRYILSFTSWKELI